MSQIFTTQFPLRPRLLKERVAQRVQHALASTLKHEFFDLVSGHIQRRDLPLQTMLQEPHEVHAALGCEGEGRGALD